VRVVGGCFVVALQVMLGCFMVVVRSVFMMLRRLRVMMRCFL
jgi:hypothetical protein